jgi:hypothetical protein
MSNSSKWGTGLEYGLVRRVSGKYFLIYPYPAFKPTQLWKKF